MLQDLHLRFKGSELNDMFFGFRINPDIVKDEQGSPSWRRVSREAPHSTRVQLKFAHWFYGEFAIVKNLGGQI
jgi:hypothetical protein